MATRTRRSSVISLFTRAPIVSVASNHTCKYSVFKGTIISPSPTCGATVEARTPPPPPRTRRRSLPHPHPPASAPRRTPAPRRTRGAWRVARRPRPQSPIDAKGHARAGDDRDDAHRAATYLCVRVRERSRERDATMACACAEDDDEDDDVDDVDDVTDDRGPGTPTGEWVLYLES